MNINEHTTPQKLEKYSFWWSEARLIIAAIALFLGGVPPVYRLLGYSQFVYMLLVLSWIVSGLSAAYLLYRWSKARTLFGMKDQKDTYAFVIMIVSGLNLGLAGLLGRNIGMSISSNQIVFTIVGVLYLLSAYHLYMRWSSSGQKIF